MPSEPLYLTTPLFYLNAEPHHGRLPRALRAADPGPGARARRRLLRQLPRPLLLRLRAFLPGARAGRRRLSRPPRGTHGDRRGELLLPHGRLPGAPAGGARGAAGPDRPRRIPPGSPGAPARADRRPLHLAAEEPPRLGDRAPVRRPLRHLRVVRRAAQLRERARAPRPPGPLADRAPSDRQGHPEAARHLLADHADGGRAAPLPPPLRPRPLADAGRQDGEEPRQRGAPARPEGTLPAGRGPLLPAARHGPPAGRPVQRGGAGDAPGRRPRQPARPPGEARARPA